MIRMLIVGYCYGIRSERRLCEEAHLNLAYRWFCRLSLEDEVPNHSTFSKNRHGRFRDSDLFRWLFNEVLRRCMDAGLVKGEGFAVDASIIKADASRQRGVPGDEPVNRSVVRVCHRHCSATIIHEGLVSREVDLSHAQLLLVDPFAVCGSSAHTDLCGG